MNAANGERPVTVPEFARMTGENPRTVRRRLLHLHAQKPGPWLWRLNGSTRSQIFVSVSALRRAHPMLFEDGFASRAEVARLQQDMAELRKRCRAMVGLVKRLQSALVSSEHLRPPD